jgi:hypothetical protein
MTSKTKSLVTILWIGLVSGTLDITDNLIFNQLRGITPKMVFQYIASGLIGMKAFRDGLASMVLGVAIHYTIALIWTGVFYAASRKLAILSRRPILSGLVYGGAIYLFMNFIILPLSRVPHPPSATTLASRNQRGAGPSAFHWITDLASCAPKFNAGKERWGCHHSCRHEPVTRKCI